MKNIAKIWQSDFQQKTYRKLLFAMSRPGKIIRLVNEGMAEQASDGILSALIDSSVYLCDHHSVLRQKMWSLLNARNSKAEDADYLLVDGAVAPDFEPHLGVLESPDLSATLIVNVSGLSSGMTLQLSGPGVDGTERISVEGLRKSWIQKREQWVAGFPLGVDLFIADSCCVTALPRTTKVEMI
jgi:alpha-D-ribose 1-methylphosphonate 5-triphosphate synthase subunit PhnH